MGCAVLFAGCDQAFGLDHVPFEPSDASRADVSSTPVDGGQDDAPRAGCPAGYAFSRADTGGVTTYYRRGAGPMSWDAAQASCLSDQMPLSLYVHLAVLGDDMERAFAAMPAGAIVWIGLTQRKTHGTFLWVTDESTAFPPAAGPPWLGGAPSPAVGSDCVETGDATIQNVPCTTKLSFLCECDVHENDPTHYF